MTNEQKLGYIKNYIDEIEAFNNDPHFEESQKRHISRALETYSTLFSEAQKGKIDPDILHENITSFLYMLQ